MKKILFSLLISLSLIGNAQATALSVPYATKKAAQSRLINNKTLIGGAIVLGGASAALHYVNIQNNAYSRLPQLDRKAFEKVYNDPPSIVPYLKRNPKQIDPFTQQVVANLNRPIPEQYPTYAILGGYLGLPGFPSPDPTKPTILPQPEIDIKFPMHTGSTKPIKNPLDDLYGSKPHTTTTPKSEPIPELPGFAKDESDSYRDYIVEANKVHSKELAKNMEKAGYGAKPKDYAAHHVVPWQSPKAENARKSLEKFNIDVDSSENGVYLPQNSSTKNSNEAYHPEIHTDRYFQEVEARLLGAKQTKAGIQKALRDIANQLKNNTFPY